MGARSGGGGAGSTGGGNYKGSISNIESLKNIQDPKLYKEMKQAISRYHAVLGVQEKNVKLADLEDNVLGVQSNINGQSVGVYLNKKYFKTGTPKQITSTMKTSYEKGFLTKTNNPIQHALTHELAHATWNSSMTNPKAVAAGKEIGRLYSKWQSDKSKTGYGRYAHSNVSEFWAETVTKSIHGTSDKYTVAVKGIAKKYNL